jgi:hypothetical protein
LALFGRRPIERVAAILFTGIQKTAQKLPFERIPRCHI